MAGIHRGRRVKLGALEPYEGALRSAQQLSLVSADGRVLPLAIQRYLDDADAADDTVLGRCVAPVLDVGCGPGRIVHALAASGLPALGVDIAEVAVALTVERGAQALSRDVFQRLPGEGRWPTVLVLDGNIGIGGDVTALLRRLAALLAATGAVIAEASAAEPGTHDVMTVRFSDGSGAVGPDFEWAVISVDQLVSHANAAGLVASDQWSAGGRDFVRLQRCTDTA
jgi:SAM-dependent methyltransferase